MDPEASGPEEVYFVVRVEGREFGPEPNITIIPPARIGKEFPKTFGHYHQHNEKETYRVLYGKAILLIQKPEKGSIDRIEGVKVLPGKAGDTLTVPEGYGHCLINTSNDLLVTADWEAKTAGHVYEPIKKMQGFCYYLIEKDGKIKFVRNPKYQKVPPVNHSFYQP